ncbi:MAG: PAS domain-containing protein [Flavobacteriales bacterium]|nr:PAS domain-containing protein [Flavobacteriales bacterium]
MSGKSSVYFIFVRLFFPLTIFVLVCLFVIGGLNQYHKSKNLIERKLETLTSTYTLLLANPVVNNDADAIRNYVVSLLSDVDIDLIRVTDSNNLVLFNFGDMQDVEKKLQRTRIIRYADESGITIVGNLTLGISLDRIYDDLAYQLEVAIMIFMLVIITAYFISRLAFKRSIGDPLNVINEAMKAFETDHKHRPIKSTFGTEINTVATSFNSLQQRIHEYESEQKRMLESKGKELDKEHKDHEQTSEQLLTTRHQAEITLNSLVESVITTNGKGYVNFINPAARQLISPPTNEGLGKLIWELLSFTESRSFSATIANDLLDGTIKRHEMKEVSLSNVNGEDVIVNLRVSPLFNSKEKIIGLSLVLQDITVSKSLEKQVRRSQKMEAIGKLSGGIAHDFNNILAIIMGNLELQQQVTKNDDKASKRIQSAFSAVERGTEITRKMLSFSTRESQGEMVTSVNDSISSLEHLISKSLTASINIESRLSHDLWTVTIDPTEFENAIINLAVNAGDAMPDGGKLTITTTNRVIEGDLNISSAKENIGEFVVITISDTGIGMSEEVQSKIFDPFYTTKDMGKGTGFGLSMVYGFVQRSGGYLTVDSSPEKGSTFEIFLPRGMS